MATTTSHQEGSVGTRSEGVTGAIPEDHGHGIGPRLTGDQVWQALAKASFAYLSHVTPSGEPRSSGVVYKVVGGRLCVAVSPDSWKARHIAANRRVAVTVPVRRAGSCRSWRPPATVTFHGQATVHPSGSAQARSLLKEMGSLIPPERRTSGSIVEVLPECEFLTYGLGVSLRKMFDPTGAQERVPVTRAAIRRVYREGSRR